MTCLRTIVIVLTVFISQKGERLVIIVIDETVKRIEFTVRLLIELYERIKPEIVYRHI